MVAEVAQVRLLSVGLLKVGTHPFTQQLAGIHITLEAAITTFGPFLTAWVVMVVILLNGDLT